MKAAGINRFVVDASVTLAWCFQDERTPFSEAVLDLLAANGEAVCPAVWPLEVTNALLVGERRKRLTSADIGAVLKRVADLPISVDPIRIRDVFGAVLFLAREEQLSVYDASYIELALREGLPLATLDKRLRDAARHRGVPPVRT